MIVLTQRIKALSMLMKQLPLPMKIMQNGGIL